jgi:hypothetical protein
MKDRCHYYHYWLSPLVCLIFCAFGNAFNVQANCSYSTTLTHDVSLSASVPTITLTTADCTGSHFLTLNLDSWGRPQKPGCGNDQIAIQILALLVSVLVIFEPTLRHRWLCPANHIHRSVQHIVLDLPAHTADDLGCQFTAATLHLPRVFHVYELRPESVQVSMKPFRWLLLAAEAYHRATFLSVSNIVFCGRRG